MYGDDNTWKIKNVGVLVLTGLLLAGVVIAAGEGGLWVRSRNYLNNVTILSGGGGGDTSHVAYKNQTNVFNATNNFSQAVYLPGGAYLDLLFGVADAMIVPTNHFGCITDNVFSNYICIQPSGGESSVVGTTQVGLYLSLAPQILVRSNATNITGYTNFNSDLNSRKTTFLREQVCGANSTQCLRNIAYHDHSGGVNGSLVPHKYTIESYNLDTVYNNNNSRTVTIDYTVQFTVSAKNDAAYVDVYLNNDPIQSNGVVSDGYTITQEHAENQVGSFTVPPFQNFSFVSNLAGSGSIQLLYTNRVEI